MTASLVVQTSYLGDVVLTTPLLRALAARGPVDVLATPGGAAVLDGHPAVRRVIPYDKRGSDRGVPAFVRLAHRLRGGAYARAYLAQGSFRSGALALAAGIPERIGFASSAGRRFYTTVIPYQRDRHHAERLWRLHAGAEAASPAPETLRPSLHPGDHDRRAVDAVLADAGHAGEPLVAVAPGSIWGTKRWPHFAALLALLDRAWRPVVVGGPDDAALGEHLATVLPGRDVIDATGRLSLLGSAELLRRCAALVTNDSAPQHLASAVDTPTVALFGPTVPAFGFGPLARGSVSLGVEGLPCRPCHAHGPQQCPLAHWRCMQELPPSRVVAVLRTLVPTPL